MLWPLLALLSRGVDTLGGFLKDWVGSLCSLCSLCSSLVVYSMNVSSLSLGVLLLSCLMSGIGLVFFLVYDESIFFMCLSLFSSLMGLIRVISIVIFIMVKVIFSIISLEGRVPGGFHPKHPPSLCDI